MTSIQDPAPADANLTAPGADGNPPDAVDTRHPVIEILSLAAPTVVTMTSYTLMQAVDQFMVSRIGPDPVYVGAQGNGGLAAFVPIAIVMGIITVINTYVSQNFGAKHPERGPAYTWNGLWICVAAWLLLLPYGYALPFIFEAFFPGHSPHQVELESHYGQILVYGALLTMATRCVAQFFYGMHRPMIVLIAGVIANLINLALNYALIFGEWGMPRLGIAGSAIGTVIATGVELALPMTLFLGPSLNRLYGTRRAWRPSLPHIRDILRIGWPPGLMFGNEMVCWAMFMVGFVGQFGPHHSTAGWIAHRWMSLSFMPAVGISVAVTAMVGKCIGMGRLDLAAKRAWAGLGLALVYMGLCGVAFIVFRRPMIRLFIEQDTDPVVAAELVRLGSMFLIATAAFQLFDAIAMTMSGALRGAGDTVWVGIATVFLSWGLIVGGGLYMVTFHPELESLGPWIAAASYIIILSLVILGRFISGRWKRINLVRPPGSPD
jgi:multidrug resistance protein, MATE family